MVPCTIVIPTHNRDDLLVRAVCSALRACPADGEVLVVDDKSIIPAEQVLSSVSNPRLRVIVNTGPSGASSARNLGVSCASGDVVFFLDDDDEILPGYCDRVLCADGPASQAEWGFASILERRAGQSSDILRQRRRLVRGLVPRHARMRDAVAAMSDGFWIRRRCFMDARGLDPEQRVDEDTDLCMRLRLRALRPWYEPIPGMVVYRGYMPARENGAQLTVATPADVVLACYRRTHDKFVSPNNPDPAARFFLATRYLRRAVKSGRHLEALSFAKSQTTWIWSLVLIIFTRFKQWSHRH